VSWVMRAQTCPRWNLLGASFVIVILCVVVMMQMLGVPGSLWDLNQEYEELFSPIIGWTVPSASKEVIVLPSWFNVISMEASSVDAILVRSLFHPPR
jgi:uncharacterized membrane protein YagU involved in acid resistance